MQQPELKTARDVSEYLLKVTAQALLDRDFETFSSVFGVPHKMTTAESTIWIHTEAELRKVFEQMCLHFTSNGITELRRTCEAAEFHGPRRVVATHTSHVVANGKYVTPPYPVFSVLEKQDGLWKVSASDYALSDTQSQGQALHPRTPSDERAIAIYQDHLDRTTESLMKGDLAAFKKTIMLPHEMRGANAVMLTATEEELETNFQRFADKYLSMGTTHFFRLVKEAYFHAEDDIRGVHESHLIRGGTRLIPPYLNRVRLKLSPSGLWQETHSTNAIQNTADRLHLWAEVSEDTELPDLIIDPERNPT